ncbi:MAG TPA: plastocyanin/azurin family copper-binding protein [Actinomycetota bacterium]|nr:plastocyanin/azurin family copper-binding protein [Actinomycetota bacterium]
MDKWLRLVVGKAVGSVRRGAISQGSHDIVPGSSRSGVEVVRDTRRALVGGFAAVTLVAMALAVLPLVRARGAESKVQMVGTQFVPAVTAIQTGDSVTWENAEATNYPVVIGVHNIISDDNAFTPSPPISPGKSWSLTFLKPGTFPYHCGVHPNQMKGVVKVDGDPQPEPSGTAAKKSDGQSVTSDREGKLRKVELTVAERDITVLGVPTKWWTYDGTVPGTTIRANVGDTLEITLKNPHNLPHAIHTHFEEYELSSDGSSMTASLPMVPHQEDDTVGAVGGIVPGAAQQPGPKVGQNPIGPYDPRHDSDVARPGGSFTYRYKLTEPGTSWYHCHVFEATDHIEKGLYGMIVVYPKGWTWKPLPPDPINGNTKAWVTNDLGEKLFEDLVIIGERNPAADSAVGLAGTGGVTGGPLHLANARGWNDPYIIGPVRSGQKILLHVGNIGESMHSWHMHAHHFTRLEQFSEESSPGWFTRPLEHMHTKSVSPGEIFPMMITARRPGYWFNHDHVVPQAYLGMVPWLHVLPAEVAASAVGSKTAEVKIVESKADDPESWKYDSSELNITVGDKVVWRNTGKQDHTVTSASNSSEKFDSGTMKAGVAWEKTFSATGVFDYYCTVHPWMKGTVSVAAVGAKAPAVSHSKSSGSHTSASAKRPSASGTKKVAPNIKIVEGKPDVPDSWVYDPSEVTVSKGETVTWRNLGKLSHTVTTAGATKVFDSSGIAPGGTWKYTFNTEGVFAYICTLHPWMKGVVKVGDNGVVPVAMGGHGGEAMAVTTDEAAPKPVSHQDPQPLGTSPVALVAFGFTGAAALGLAARTLLRRIKQ